MNLHLDFDEILKMVEESQTAAVIVVKPQPKEKKIVVVESSPQVKIQLIGNRN
jgi:hypothetical protein